MEMIEHVSHVLLVQVVPEFEVHITQGGDRRYQEKVVGCAWHGLV